MLHSRTHTRAFLHLLLLLSTTQTVGCGEPTSALDQTPSRPLSLGSPDLPDHPDPTPTSPEKQRRAAQIARLFQGAYLVAQHGKVLASSGVGKANRSTGEDNTATTSFRLASVSKPLTAVAVMQLVEQHRLNVDDTVSQHVPDYGPNGERIKIRHLLSHSSGIPDYIDAVGEVPSSAALIDVFKNWRLNFTPGSQYSYSNSNYALLGFIIEKVTGIAYDAYIQENVFAKADMPNAGYEFPRHPGPGFAAPNGGNPNGGWEPNSKAYAAGALYASVNDMFYFHHALRNGLLVGEEQIDAMETRHAGRYGFGWFVDGDSVSHSGSITGFTSQIYSYPESEGLVIALANGSANASTLASRLRDLLDD